MTKAEDAFGLPLDYPYLMGAYLAVNALPDVALLVDGPDCAVGKAEHIVGKHDWRSTLRGPAGRDRVVCTLTDVRNAALSREPAIREAMAELLGRPDLSAVLVCALPMANLTGTDYARLARLVREAEGGKPLILVPARSLQGGFLDGYSETLQALAREAPLGRGVGRRLDRRKVAVIGSFMDRTEEDHRANGRELRRMLEALGVEAVTGWLEGGPFADLAAAGEAGTLVALPWGRKAALALAARTGARVVDAGVPFGLDASSRWLKKVAGALGREDRAGRFIDAELGRIAPKLEWIVPYHFLNRRVWVACDPYLLGPIAGLLAELGGRVVGAATVGRGIPACPPKRPGSIGPVLERPTSGRLERAVAGAWEGGLDLAIGNSDVAAFVPPACPFAEFGFPSYFRHALSARPFLGFEGCLAFLDLLCDAMAGRDRGLGRSCGKRE
ncbi:MAG: hypothetical protein HY927_09460 [Elusimicrobia bacterium]|nr:hypothetical protein [Elusimicrobiota bacterium]